MPATCNKQAVVVATSGGVDSAACAMLLKDAGHDVFCVYFVMSDAHLPGADDARGTAQTLGIPFEAIDLRARFRENVILPFCREYCDGATPNPCIICNPLVKFAALIEAADRMGCEKIATGHYARVEQREGGYVLRRAACLDRDQSYMLYRLGQSVLSRLLLPLGELSKGRVREMAAARGLSAANAGDSQEICFIPDGDHAAYIHAAGFSGKPGCFIAPDGTLLGPHNGVERYTVGQRRGLGVALGRPVFVRSIKPDGNILLGFSGEEYSSGAQLDSCEVNPLYSDFSDAAFTVKIRSMAPPAPCRASQSADGGILLRFNPLLRAPAPGQSAVLYDGDFVVGGGRIARVM